MGNVAWVSQGMLDGLASLANSGQSNKLFKFLFT